jgi:hypothetical protein
MRAAGVVREAGPDTVRGTVATGRLELFDRIVEEQGSLLLLVLKESSIRHISSLKARLLYFNYYKKPGLSFDKLKSLATAYSYPRRVRIISFREDGYYNIFPMDLLGEIPRAGRYVFGLRHTNHTLARIIETKKIVVSEVPAGYKDSIYQLGSHHSGGPPPLEQLPFAVMNSPRFGFWIPEWAESCQEIRILKTVNLGSHMLLWGEPLSESLLKLATPRLHHIHFLHYLGQKARGLTYPPV